MIYLVETYCGHGEWAYAGRWKGYESAIEYARILVADGKGPCRIMNGEKLIAYVPVEVAAPKPAGIDIEIYLNGQWVRAATGVTSAQMKGLMTHFGDCPARALVAGLTVATNNVAPETPAPPVHSRRFHIVMNLDGAGPRERTGGRYFRHYTEDAAHTEAERLAKQHVGQEFGVLTLTYACKVAAKPAVPTMREVVNRALASLSPETRALIRASTSEASVRKTIRDAMGLPIEAEVPF